MIIDVKVVTTHHQYLEETLKTLVKDGWEFQGTLTSPTGNYLSQVMVKHSSDNTEPKKSKTTVKD